MRFVFGLALPGTIQRCPPDRRLGGIGRRNRRRGSRSVVLGGRQSALAVPFEGATGEPGAKGRGAGDFGCPLSPPNNGVGLWVPL
jgi:hypothetical protein